MNKKSAETPAVIAGPVLKHSVAEYSNSFLRDLNAATSEGRGVEPEDLYAIKQTFEDGYELFDGVRLRRTPAGEKTVGQLIQPGAIVKSTFGYGKKTITTGPYVVVTVHEYEVANGITCWSLVCNDAPDHAHRRDRSESYLNELVSVGGRVLALFEANDGEVHILKAAEVPVPVSLWDLHQQAIVQRQGRRSRPPSPATTRLEEKFPFKKGALVTYKEQSCIYEVGGKQGSFTNLVWPGSGSGICVSREDREHVAAAAGGPDGRQVDVVPNQWNHGFHVVFNSFSTFAHGKQTEVFKTTADACAFARKHGAVPTIKPECARWEPEVAR